MRGREPTNDNTTESDKSVLELTAKIRSTNSPVVLRENSAVNQEQPLASSKNRFIVLH